MSGGHFDYQQFRLHDIAEQIQHQIDNNKTKPDWVSSKDWDGQLFTDKTIGEFKLAVNLLRVAEVYAQRIDWLLSGDDSEETFHERLDEDLKSLSNNQW